MAPSGERLRRNGRCGVFAVWKLCDPHLSASEVSFLLWGAIQMSVFTSYLYMSARTLLLVVTDRKGLKKWMNEKQTSSAPPSERRGTLNRLLLRAVFCRQSHGHGDSVRSGSWGTLVWCGLGPGTTTSTCCLRIRKQQPYKLSRRSTARHFVVSWPSSLRLVMLRVPNYPITIRYE